MQKTEMAIACMENLRTMDREINTMLEYRKVIMDLAYRVTSAPSNTPVQRDTGTSRVESGGIRLAEYGAEIDKRIDSLVALKKDALQMIDQLSDHRMRLLLVMRYMNNWEWDTVIEKMSYEPAQVYRLHRRAMAELQKVMVANNGAGCAAWAVAGGG